MAKIFRVFGYLISSNSDENNGTKEDVLSELNAIEPAYPVWWNGLRIDEADLGEWDDGHPLNQVDCPTLTCARCFEESDQYVGPALEVRKVYESYLDVGFDEDQAMRLTEAYIRVAFEKAALGMYNKPRSATKADLLRRMQERRVQTEKEDTNDG